MAHGVVVDMLLFTSTNIHTKQTHTKQAHTETTHAMENRSDFVGKQEKHSTDGAVVRSVPKEIAAVRERYTWQKTTTKQ